MGLHRFVAAKTRVCRVFADRRHLVALAAWVRGRGGMVCARGSRAGE